MAVTLVRAACGALAAALALAWLPAAAAGAAQSARLTPAQAEAVERVEAYLNGIRTLHARFVQTTSRGARASGEVYLKRPGKVYFEYDPPHPVVILANGGTVLYFDRELQQTSYLPLSQTPLWFLLRETIEIDAEEDLRLAAVERGPETLALEITQPEAGAGGSVTLIFAREPLELSRWRVVDAQGVTTEVALVGLRTGVAIDPERFEAGSLDLPEPDLGRPQR